MEIKFEKKGYQFQVGIDENLKIQVEVQGKRFEANAYRHSKVGWGFNIKGNEVKKILGNDDIFLVHPEAEKFWKYREKMKEEKKQQALQEGIQIIFRQEVSDYDWPSIPLKKWTFDSPISLPVEAGKFFLFLQEKNILQPQKRIFSGWSEVELIDYIATVTTKLLEEFATWQTPKEKREREIFEKARVTGEKQLLSKWVDDCNAPDEECDVDNVYLYAMPDGTTTIERHHTW